MTLASRSAADDLRDLPLGDPRRTKRWVRCVELIEKRPDGSFPEILPDDAGLEAFYRLMNNRDVRYDRVVDHMAGKVWAAARDAGGLIAPITQTRPGSHSA